MRSLAAATWRLAQNDTCFIIMNFENRYLTKSGELITIIWSAHWDNDEKQMSIYPYADCVSL